MIALSMVIQRTSESEQPRLTASLGSATSWFFAFYPIYPCHSWSCARGKSALRSATPHTSCFMLKS